MMTKITPQTKTFFLGLSLSILILVSFFGGAIADRIFVIKPLDALVGRSRALLLSRGGESRTSLGSLLKQSLSVADVAEVASESVVTVATKRQERVFDPSSDGFSSLFGLGNSSRIEEVQRDIGSGFVVAGQGLIVTNKHVVDDLRAEYLVIDSSDREYLVTQIYRDPVNDLAILKVEDFNLASLPMGDSDQLRVGQEVIAIGTALGEFRHTVTTGVISGLGRGLSAIDSSAGSINTLEGVIQTDAAINPGNSGGPLLDRLGNVIGVNAAVARAENIGFAIPINVVRASLDNFNATGQFDRPFLGVRYSNITESAAIFNEVPQGAYLAEVSPEGSAAEAGLQAGDILLEFDGQNLIDNQLSSLVNQKKIGSKVTVTYWRDAQEQTIEITLQ